MLEKSAKISTVVQGVAALVFLYSFFFPQTVHQGTDSTVLHPTLHQSWLPLVSIVFLVASVIVSSILSLAALRRHNVPPPPPIASGQPSPKLVIRRAVYGAGSIAELDITKRLNDSARDALVIPINNNFLVPTDPALNVRKTLDVDYSYGSDTVFRVSRMEPPPGDIARLVLPEDTEIARLQKELSHWQAKHSTEKANDLNEKAMATNKVLQLEAKQNSLLNRITVVVRETLTFLRDQGPSPKLQLGDLESESSRHAMVEMEKRVHKIHSGFSLHLHPEIDKIILELGKQGIFDYSLATLMQNPAHGETNIRTIADKLVLLRDRLEKLEYGGINEGT